MNNIFQWGPRMLTRPKISCLSLLVLALFILVNNTHAQVDTTFEDSLCAYTWNSDYNECPDVLDCIYPLQWNDKTVQVPANITHISREGLKLCLDDLEIGGEADIIYIMDLSWSMYKTSNNGSPIQYPDPGWQNVGDPHRIRDDALEAGFNFQRTDYPRSTAGYIGFGADLIPDIGSPWSGYFTNNHLLPCVNVVSGQTQLDQMVTALRNDLETDGQGTNYYAPLEKALEWINNSSITPHEDKAIIFISDGDISVGDEPDDPAFVTLLNQIKNAGVKIHGIYLGPSLKDDLAGIVDPTGGTLTLIPPTAPADSLASVIKQIIQNEIDPFEPVGISVNNLTTGSNATAVSYTEVEDTIWQAILNKPVALKPDLNEIRLNSKFTTPSGKDTVLTFKFYIDVGGEPYTNECYYCWYRTQLKVLVNNVQIDTLTWENDEYTVQLEYYGYDTLDQVDIVVRTTRKGDYEVITITDFTFDGEKFIYSATVPFSVLTSSQNATSNNGTTESDYEDLITFSWQHPEEVLDTAYTEVIVSAPPNKIEIHDKAGQPSSATKYPTAPEVDTITAGILAELYAKIFANDKWLDDYENNPDLSKLITWDVVDASTGLADTSIGTLTTNNNSHNSFFPIKAYHTVDITAYLDVSGLGTIKETIRLYIKPGEPKMLVIENTNDITQTQSLNDPCHWSPIEIFGNQTDITAYAILRDSLGNWVNPAEQALWSVDDTSVVTVDPGPDDEGNIHKATRPSGLTLLHAVQSPLPEDTAVVITYEYDIDSIRIVRVHNGDTADVTDLTMNTNQDTTLHVIGRRNDFNTWIPVSGKWGIDPFATEQNPPAAANRWFFSPSRPDTGVIFAEFAGNHDTVNYFFTVGPPIKVTFEIITPDSLLIAGEIIEGVVSVMNEDGLVPGIWKYPKTGNDPGGDNKAKYTDILDNGFDDPVNPIDDKWEPFAQTEEDSVNFNNKELSIVQWFNEGIDTIDFVLYYAPIDESPHKFTVYLDALSAQTDPFVLKPGPLDTIVLKPDTLPDLTTDDVSFIVTATGYDKFGNKLPNEIFSWSNDSSLVDFNINALSTQIYIDPSKAKITQQGYIHVKGTSDSTVTNKLYLKIFGPLPTISLALTRDITGNGFLDAIELSFNKAVNIPPDYDPSHIIVEKEKNGNIYFRVDSLVLADNTGKKLMLYLNEDNKNMSDDEPETAWKPYLTIDDLDSIKPVNQLQCEDGAAPVIWDVFKHVNDINDQTKDVVTVTLSENFYNVNGAKFLTVGPKPPDVLYVYEYNSTTGDTVKIDSILVGIEQFDDQDKDYTVFKMTNGKNLHANHFMNLEHLVGYTADKDGNVPNENNQKVRVRITGDIGNIQIGPNPLIPNIVFFNKHKDDPLIYIPNEELFNIIKTNGGVMITIPLKGIVSAEMSMIVFDAVGNLVYSNKSDDNILDDNEVPDHLVQVLKDGVETVQFPLYWHGITSKGMKSAPGLYKIIIFANVTTTSGDEKTLKEPVTAAVGR